MTRPSPRVYVEALDQGYPAVVSQGLEEVGFFRDVPAGATVFLKPNLTFPVYRPGVMTSYECLKSAIHCLIDRGYRVIVGEADSGGYNRFSMDEVFDKMGIHELARTTGARVVNISYTEAESIELRVGWRRLTIPLPRLLLREVDAFISLPVPKIHMNTLVSLSLKNQWGCIQEPAQRLRLHPYFAPVIHEVNRRLPKPYSIIDGHFGLNRSGPMRGDAVEFNWLLVANDLVAADRVACRLMRIDERRVGYLRYFQQQGWWCPFQQIAINRPLEPFQREAFYLRRTWTDLPGQVCFNNAFLAWVGYRSPLAGFLHWLLYLFRQPFYDYEAEKKRVRSK